MNKVYSRINWENYPSEATPLNEANLNKLDVAVNNIDDRVVTFDTTKVNHTDILNNIKSWTMDETTGIITITKYDDSQIIFDLNIEKIPVKFELSDDGILKMTTSDGTEFTANIGAMIPIITFNDSDTIAVTVSGTGINKTYSFEIKNGSITDEKLQPNYLADITLQAEKGKQSEILAEQYKNNAKTSEDNAKQSEDNAKISEDNAKLSETNASASESRVNTNTLLAEEYKNNALASMNSASVSEANSKDSETKAKVSETNAKSSEEKAKTSEINAKASENTTIDYKNQSAEILEQEKEILAEAKRIINPPEVMKGATVNSDGVEGLVPKPLIADRTKFLKGNGTWAEVNMDEKANGKGLTFYIDDNGRPHLTYRKIESEVEDIVINIFDGNEDNDIAKDNDTQNIVTNIFDDDPTNDEEPDSEVDEIINEIFKQQ